MTLPGLESCQPQKKKVDIGPLNKSEGQWMLKWDFIFINEAMGSQLADVELGGREI